MLFRSRLYGNRSFRKLLCAHLISRWGDNFTLVLASFLMAHLTGSALKGGVIFAIGIMAEIFAEILAGSYVENRPLRSLMVNFDLYRAVLGFSLLVPLYFPSCSWLILVVIFVNSVLTVFFFSARGKAVRAVVGDAQIKEALAVSSAWTWTVNILGFGMAGMMVKGLGYRVSVLVDPLTFLASALILSRTEIPITAIFFRVRHAWKEEVKSFFHLIWTEPSLRSINIARSLAMAGAGIFNVLFIYYLLRILQGGPATYGYLEASKSLGFVLASGLILPTFLNRMSLRQLYVLGAILFGGGLVVMSRVDSVSSSCFFYFVSGIGMCLSLLASSTLYARVSSLDKYARVQAFSQWSVKLVSLVFMALTYWMVAVWDWPVKELLALSGMGPLAGGIYLACRGKADPPLTMDGDGVG